MLPDPLSHRLELNQGVVALPVPRGWIPVFFPLCRGGVWTLAGPGSPDVGSPRRCRHNNGWRTSPLKSCYGCKSAGLPGVEKTVLHKNHLNPPTRPENLPIFFFSATRDELTHLSNRCHHYNNLNTTGKTALPCSLHFLLCYWFITPHYLIWAIDSEWLKRVVLFFFSLLFGLFYSIKHVNSCVAAGRQPDASVIHPFGARWKGKREIHHPLCPVGYIKIVLLYYKSINHSLENYYNLIFSFCSSRSVRRCSQKLPNYIMLQRLLIIDS